MVRHHGEVAGIVVADHFQGTDKVKGLPRRSAAGKNRQTVHEKGGLFRRKHLPYRGQNVSGHRVEGVVAEKVDRFLHALFLLSGLFVPEECREWF
ncbi:hypothetical protein SDC9_161017 [bioreactor metagenome]|uniref:Uncharacterized protein n=1 Tax=bioreactor metagenome TaxID=1076179 RepID=A0A645FNC7_9ZZZZ